MWLDLQQTRITETVLKQINVKRKQKGNSLVLFIEMLCENGFFSFETLSSIIFYRNTNGCGCQGLTHRQRAGIEPETSGLEEEAAECRPFTSIDKKELFGFVASSS